MSMNDGKLNKDGAGNLSGQDLSAAQDAFEQFLLSSPYVNNDNSNQGVRLKNTFIEFEQTDDFVS